MNVSIQRKREETAKKTTRTDKVVKEGDDDDNDDDADNDGDGDDERELKGKCENRSVIARSSVDGLPGISLL